MNITVRKCMISDADRIRELYCELTNASYPADKFEASLRRLMVSPNNIVLVAENNNVLLGFAHACSYDELCGPVMKYLSAIAVDEKYRRYGAARKLLEGVEKWARQSGAEGVLLYSGAERNAANAFYKSCGYEFVKPEFHFKKVF